MLKKIIGLGDQGIILQAPGFEEEFYSEPVRHSNRNRSFVSKYLQDHQKALWHSIHKAADCHALLWLCRKEWANFSPGQCKQVLQRLIQLAGDSNAEFRMIRRDTALILRILKGSEPVLAELRPKELLKFVHDLAILNISYAEFYPRCLELLHDRAD